jgi:quercetin dioxygenase-like cupin family protein
VGSFRDERGIIEDLLDGPLDAVTRIFTRAGSVRGNHMHKLTVQYTYIVSGMLLVVSAPQDGPRTESLHRPGDLVLEAAGIPHAWKAKTDTTVLVFTRGPRAGEAYESDTTRLAVPLIKPGAFVKGEHGPELASFARGGIVPSSPGGGDDVPAFLDTSFIIPARLARTVAPPAAS